MTTPAYVARIYYSADGNNPVLPVPFPYLNKADVHVYVSGTAVAFTWVDSSHIQPTVAPPAGTNNVLVQRITQSTSPLAVIQSGTIRPADVNKDHTQFIYLIQEANDAILFVKAEAEANLTAAAPRVVFNTMALMRAGFPNGIGDGTLVSLLGYWAAGDGGGGDFRYDAASTKLDDLGIVIALNGAGPTGRLIRQHTPGERNILWFGGRGNLQRLQGSIDGYYCAMKAGLPGLKCVFERGFQPRYATGAWAVNMPGAGAAGATLKTSGGIVANDVKNIVMVTTTSANPTLLTVVSGKFDQSDVDCVIKIGGSSTYRGNTDTWLNSIGGDGLSAVANKGIIVAAATAVPVIVYNRNSMTLNANASQDATGVVEFIGTIGSVDLGTPNTLTMSFGSIVGNNVGNPVTLEATDGSGATFSTVLLSAPLVNNLATTGTLRDPVPQAFTAAAVIFSYGATIAKNTNLATVYGATFTSADAGKAFNIDNALGAAGPLQATIVLAAGNQVTLSANATQDVRNQTCSWYNDDTPAWEAALNSWRLNASAQDIYTTANTTLGPLGGPAGITFYQGGTLHIPKGQFCVNGGRTNYDIFGLILQGRGSRAVSNFTKSVSGIVFTGMGNVSSGMNLNTMFQVAGNGARGFDPRDIDLCYLQDAYCGHMLDLISSNKPMQNVFVGRYTYASRRCNAASLIRTSQTELLNWRHVFLDGGNRGILIDRTRGSAGVNACHFDGVTVFDTLHAGMVCTSGGSLGQEIRIHIDPITTAPLYGVDLQATGAHLSGTFNGAASTGSALLAWAKLTGTMSWGGCEFGGATPVGVICSGDMTDTGGNAYFSGVAVAVAGGTFKNSPGNHGTQKPLGCIMGLPISDGGKGCDLTTTATVSAPDLSAAAGGVQATVLCVVANGHLVDFIITNPGRGYIKKPTVTFGGAFTTVPVATTFLDGIGIWMYPQWSSGAQTFELCTNTFTPVYQAPTRVQATTVSGSKVLTVTSGSTSHLAAGFLATGTGMAAGAGISSFTSTTITLTDNATANGSALITFKGQPIVPYFLDYAAGLVDGTYSYDPFQDGTTYSQTLTCTIANGSPVVTGCSTVSGFDVNDPFIVNGVPTTALVQSVDSISQITLNTNATADTPATFTDAGDFQQGSNQISNLTSTTGWVKGQNLSTTTPGLLAGNSAGIIKVVDAHTVLLSALALGDLTGAPVTVSASVATVKGGTGPQMWGNGIQRKLTGDNLMPFSQWSAAEQAALAYVAMAWDSGRIISNAGASGATTVRLPVGKLNVGFDVYRQNSQTLSVVGVGTPFSGLGNTATKGTLACTAAGEFGSRARVECDDSGGGYHVATATGTWALS